MVAHASAARSGSLPESGQLELLSFRIGETTFGLELRTVREVVRPPATARVPGAPPFVRGITNLRGEVLPVVDAARRLGVAGIPSASARVVVVAHPDGAFGLQVDAVGGVLRVEDSRYTGIPPTAEGIDEAAVRGIVRHEAEPIVLLDGQALAGRESVATPAVRRPAAPPSAEGRAETRSARRPPLQVVAIRLGSEPWALPIHRVREVTRMPDLTRLPSRSQSLCGMAVLRGEVLPVIDLRRELGMASLASEAESLRLALEAAEAAHDGDADPGGDPCPLAAVLAHPALPALVDPDLRDRLERIELAHHRSEPGQGVGTRSGRSPEQASPEELSALLASARRACTDRARSRCVVIEVGPAAVGLAVDAVEEVLSIAAEDLVPDDEREAGRYGTAPLLTLARPAEQRPPLPVLDVDAWLRTAPTPVAKPQPEEPMDQTRAPQSRRQLVVFQLGGEEFAAEIQNVQEIVRLDATTRVPHAPPGVEGVMNLRGEVLPVLDLRRRFGLSARPHDEATRVVVVRVEGDRAGLIVDGVSEVLRIPESEIRPAPPLLGGSADPELVEGVAVLDGGKRTVLLVDVEALLPHPAPTDRPPSAETTTPGT